MHGLLRFSAAWRAKLLARKGHSRRATNGFSFNSGQVARNNSRDTCCELARKKQVRSISGAYGGEHHFGRLKTFAADVCFCVDNCKFEGREPLLNFIKDVVHDLRLQKDDGSVGRRC